MLPSTWQIPYSLSIRNTDTDSVWLALDRGTGKIHKSIDGGVTWDTGTDGPLTLANEDGSWQNTTEGLQTGSIALSTAGTLRGLCWG